MTALNTPALTPMANLVALLRRGREKGSVSRCNVCGLENARNDQKLNAVSHAHGFAHDEKLESRAEKLEKLLGGNIDLVIRNQYNAEATYIAQKILEARREHEIWQAQAPERAEAAAKDKGNKSVSLAPVKINEPEVIKVAREILAMLGARAEMERDPVKLLGYVRSNLSLLLNKQKGDAGMK